MASFSNDEIGRNTSLWSSNQFSAELLDFREFQMREYREHWDDSGGGPGGIRLGIGFTPAVKILMIALGVSFLALNLLAVFSKTRWPGVLVFIHALRLTPDLVIGKLYIWQLVTYTFAYGSSLIPLLFDLITLYFLGALCEQHYGRQKFFVLFFLSGIIGGLCYAIPAFFTKTFVPFAGASAALSGVTIAAGVLFPNVQVLFMLIFPIRLRTLSWIVVAIHLWPIVMGQEPSQGLAILGSCLFGYLFVKYEARFSGYFEQMERRSARAKKHEEVKTRQRVDEILEKISREGIENLTRSEKKFLKRASEEYREPPR